LNYLALRLVLLAAALSAYFTHWSIGTLGLLGVAAMLGVIMLVGPWQKISLHTSFAALAASLFWGIWPALLAGVVCVGLIGWSRLVLSRHSLSEVFLGALVGAITGACLVYLSI